jgi:acetyl esterase/lipase
VENDADHHVSNLHGIPTVIRIGAADRTVHPWFQRRMYRLMQEEGMMVNYTEVKDKEHWWWDTM